MRWHKSHHHELHNIRCANVIYKTSDDAQSKCKRRHAPTPEQNCSCSGAYSLVDCRLIRLRNSDWRKFEKILALAFGRIVSSYG